jgi:hypothetical protein
VCRPWTSRSPVSSEQQASAIFAVALPDRVADLLEMLVTRGQARQTTDGRFVV